MNEFELVQTVTVMIAAVMLSVVFGLRGVARFLMRVEDEQRQRFRREFYRD
jgi:hypothetical protein